MRVLAAAGALFVLVLASTPDVLGLPGKPSRIHRGHVGTLETAAQRAATLFRKHVVVPAKPARPAGGRRLLSALELASSRASTPSGRHGDVEPFASPAG